MRINKFVAHATGLSRRAADEAIANGRVVVNGQKAEQGREISGEDIVALDGRGITPPVNTITIMLNKPVGYVCSRNGQGSPTIYDLLPAELHYLKPIGRLDKDSSGLLLLTSDGDLANQLTHPRYKKEKIYEVSLDKPLAPADKVAIEQGIKLEDGLSHLSLSGHDTTWKVTMHEGRNRQIRRTFADRDYTVTSLHRTHFGSYDLSDLSAKQYRKV